MEQSQNVVRMQVPPGVVRGPARPKKPVEEDGEAWLVSYADMITLLFCFLVILLSVSKIDVNRMSGLKNEMDKKFSEAPQAQKSLNDIEKQLQTVVAKVGLNDEVRVRSSDRGLLLDFNAKILFTPGSAELASLKAMDLLDRIAGPLGREPIQMVVEGHTDPIPIRSNLYPSNWELSASRAASVVRYLITALKYRPERLQAVGMADTRPIGPDGDFLEKAPVSDYWTEAYLARQRRVTLVVTPVQEAPKTQKLGPDGKIETTGANGAGTTAPTSASTEPSLGAQAAEGVQGAAGVGAEGGARGAAQGAAQGAARDDGQPQPPAGPAGSEAAYFKSAWSNAGAGIDAERLSEVPYKAREGRRKMKKLRNRGVAQAEPVRQTRWE